MKKLVCIMIGLTVMISSCDLIDGTNVRNPNLTLDDAAAQQNSATAWVNGLAQRNAVVYNSLLTVAELAGDNYVNKATFFNQNVDNGVYRDTDPNFNTAQQNIARLREQAEFGLNDILENNPDAAGTELEAEMHFYKGWSHLLAGEYFIALSAEEVGDPQSPDAHFQLAVESFTRANSVNPSISYDLALARAHYALGNQSEAVSFSEAVLSADSDFVRYIEYDGVNGPTNTLQDAVYDRQSFNDFQPLPRLDFLDPKYGDLGGTNESPVVLQKAEEAHLIVAEAQLADNDLPAAQGTMQSILSLVNSRPTRDIDDTEEGRAGTVDGGTNVRPNSSSYEVRASSSAPFISGLILDRTANTTVPTVSGTSLTSTDITNLSNGQEALRALYLLRQEIFFGEGRRMVDLGIKWPISEVEALNNPNIEASERQAVIPSYIPAEYGDMDAFTVDDTNQQVTITVDMNSVIASERGNKFD
ncbi:MAG: hypothetical protein RI564_00475 [Gracilimonas sp.]|nr:hypothetical protein [Gracilimonas sp.]